MAIYNLFQLGRNDFDGSGKKLLTVPNIQRGLVWKSRQIELLWDSILRGFPIGTLTVMLKDGADETGELIDGQQRRDAILAAFKEPSTDSQSVVWIDLGFDKNLVPDRKFGIRVTTKAHPWGYYLDGSTLSAEERRRAIEEANETPGTSKSLWNILNFGPSVQVGLPVPLYYLLSAPEESRLEALKSSCQQLAVIAPEWGRRYLKKVDSLADSSIQEILEALFRLPGYAVSATEIDGKEDLEILFERIGIGGTNITQKELAYATMKYYWDSDVLTKVNGEVSEYVMPEPDFAMIVFRTFLSGKDNIKDRFSVQEIRAISRDETKKAIIEDVYAQNGAAVRYAVNTVDKWLLGSGFPPVIRSEIAIRYSKLYVFLLWIANRQRREGFFLSDEYMRALACYLYVCVNEYSARSKEKYKAWVIEYLYRNLQDIAQDFEKEMTRLLDEMIGLGWCIAPTHNLAGFRAFQNDLFSNQWDYTNFNRDAYYDYFSRLFPMNTYSLFVLKLFQKDYYKEHFGDYDPSRRDLWADTNRPWDHDHIVPQQWGEDVGEWSHVVKKLIGSIGNIADIPFELNRSKGDRSDWSHYDDNAASLLGEGNESLLEKIKAESFRKQLSTKRNAVEDFFSLILARFLLISNSFAQLIEPLNIGETLPEFIRQRKDFILSLKEKYLRDFSLYYVIDEVELPFEEDDAYGWQQQWISLEGKRGKQFVPSVTIGIDQKDCRLKLCLEYGIRKRPDKTCKEIVPSPGWWKPGYYHFVNEGLEAPDLETTILDFMGEEHDLD